MANVMNVQCMVRSATANPEVYALATIGSEATVGDVRDLVARRAGSHPGIVRLSPYGGSVFGGTLTRAFTDLGTAVDASILPGDTRYVYFATRHGGNRSLWTVTPLHRHVVPLGPKRDPASFTAFTSVSTPLATFVEVEDGVVRFENTSDGLWQAVTLNRFSIANLPGTEYTFEIGGLTPYSESRHWGFGFVPITFAGYDRMVYASIPIFTGYNRFRSGTQVFPDQSVSYVRVRVPEDGLGDLEFSVYTDDTYSAGSLHGTFTHSSNPGGFGSTVPIANPSSSTRWVLGFTVHGSATDMYVGNLRRSK